MARGVEVIDSVNCLNPHSFSIRKGVLKQNVFELRAEYVKILRVVHGEGEGNTELFKLLDGLTGVASKLNEQKLIAL